jgi:hypothetical protein
MVQFDKALCGLPSPRRPSIERPSKNLTYSQKKPGAFFKNQSFREIHGKAFWMSFLSNSQFCARSDIGFR